MSDFRCGSIALIGRPNVGKSSLLNRLVGQKLASVSPKVQTSRHFVRGLRNTVDAQFIFVDAPGLPEESKSLLARTLTRRALTAGSVSDVIALVLTPGRFDAPEQRLLSALDPALPVVAILNKIDRLPSKAELLPLVGNLSKEASFHAIVPVSARSGENVDELLRVFRDALPRAPALYPEDQLTDLDERFFAAETIREKIFLALDRDLPYRCEVMIDSFEERDRLRRIDATVLVERDSQKAIVIGRRGEMMKRIAERSRRDLEVLFGGKVFLTLWVKTRRGWADDARVLQRLGYGETK